ncbi:MAG: hypothetical protein U0L76_09720 [Ruminococcus sp.]|nr:hypothetical protein [Ruminococcus sp.]
MKKKFLSALITILLICLLCGCNGNVKNTSQATTESTTDSMCEIAVLDYKTDETLVQFSTTDNEKADILLNAISNTEKSDIQISDEPDYVLHFIDNGNSKYDSWYLVYFDEDKVYLQLDTEKTDLEGIEETSEISLCPNLTPDEFMKVLK